MSVYLFISSSIFYIIFVNALISFAAAAAAVMQRFTQETSLCDNPAAKETRNDVFNYSNNFKSLCIITCDFEPELKAQGVSCHNQI